MFTWSLPICFDSGKIDKNQRINQAFFISDSIQLSLAYRSPPKKHYIDITFKNGNKAKVNWLVRFLDYSPSLEKYGIKDGLSWRPYNALVNLNEKFDYVLEIEHGLLHRDMASIWDVTSSSGDKEMDKAVSPIIKSLNEMRQEDLLELEVAGFLGKNRHLNDTYFTRKNTNNRSEAAAAALTRLSSTYRALWNYNGVIRWKIEGYTVIVIIPTFLIPNQGDKSSDEFLYLPVLFEIQQAAKLRNITRILIDLSANSGGYVLSSMAALWHFVDSPEDVCQPQSKHMTKHWRLWVESFASDWEGSVKAAINWAGDRLGDMSFITQKFEELKILYKYAVHIIPDFRDFSSELKWIEKTLVSLASLSWEERKEAFKRILIDREFIHGKHAKEIAPEGGGWYPFTQDELLVSGHNVTFKPSLKQYTNPDTFKWGPQYSYYSEKGDWTFCRKEVLPRMDKLKLNNKEWQRGYWRDIAILSDGGCGSACSMFAMGLHMYGKATSYTFGGIADEPMSVSAFTGGNVESYAKVWPKVNFAAHLGNWATFGKAKWSELNDLDWVNYATAFPTRATATFNWNMAFHRGLGDKALPIQWYRVPSHRHIDRWARGCGHSKYSNKDGDETGIDNRISASSTGRLYLEDAIDYCAALANISNEYDIPGSEYTERWSSGRNLMRCVSQLKISRYDALFTLHNLRYGVAEAYAFTDIAKNARQSVQDNNCGFEIYDIKVDLIDIFDRKIEEMERITRGMTERRKIDYLKGGISALEFHSSVMDTLNSLYDAHTYYKSPLDMFTFVIPIGFEAVCGVDIDIDEQCPQGQQKIHLREVGLDVEYRHIFSKWPTVYHYDHLTPVSTINGEDVLDWMGSMVSGVLKGVHLGLNQRINDWFLVRDGPIYVPLAWYSVNNADLRPLRIVYEDGTSDTVEWLAKLTDYSKGLKARGVNDGLSWRVYNSLINRNEQFDYVINMEQNRFGKRLDTLLLKASSSSPAAGSSGDITLDKAINEVLSNANTRRRRLVPTGLRVNSMSFTRQIKSALVDKKLRRPNNATSSDHHYTPASSYRVHGNSFNLKGGPSVVSPIVWNDALGGTLKWRAHDNAMVVVLSSFSIDDRWSSNDGDLLPHFMQIQREARKAGISRILLDLSGNTGGSLSTAFAMLWYLLKPSEICQPQSKHITKHWNLWIKSFALDWSKSLDAGADEVWYKLEDVDFIRSKFEELRAIIRYASAIDSELVDVNAALKSIDGLEGWVVGMTNGRDRRWSFLQMLNNKLFMTEILRGEITKSESGWFPFGNMELVDPVTGERFNPPLKQFMDPETHKWGDMLLPSNYSKRAPWGFCEDLIHHQMPHLQQRHECKEGITSDAQQRYSRDYWKEIAVVTDGRCGSACTTVAATLYLSRRATTYTFGGDTRKPTAFASYAGGNVINYDYFWPRFSIASQLAHWGTLGGSKWSKKYGGKWIHYATIFPTTATASFTFNMAFHKALGKESLPVQWYNMPSDYNVRLWAQNLEQRAIIQSYVIKRDWGNDMINPKEIGSGNFCTVYKAKDVDSNKIVALKVFNKGELKRAKKEKGNINKGGGYVNDNSNYDIDVLMEKHVLSRLHHNNIIKLLYTFADTDNCYIVTQYCAGGELWNLVAHSGLGDKQCKYYLKQMAEALRYCHQAGIVHRDVKAENALLTEDRRTLKLCDFGTARDLLNPQIEGSGNMCFNKHMKHYVGTANFLAPEAIMNKENDQRSDIWSFGATVYQVRFGIPPYTAGSEYLIYLRIRHHDLQFPADGVGIERSCMDLIRWCNNEGSRPQTFDQVLAHQWFQDTPKEIPPFSLEELSIRSLARSGYDDIGMTHDDDHEGTSAPTTAASGGEMVVDDDDSVPTLPYDNDWIIEHENDLSNDEINALKRLLVVRDWERKSMPGSGTAMLDHLHLPELIEANKRMESSNTSPPILTSPPSASSSSSSSSLSSAAPPPD
ncbi:hypothetical protein FOL47_002455 [Perkinsus chesapeaki]|uniref:Protein kinase domain-containing protein n=1 Tax=Perkinsus chesapeaki TaxID=330153 RepID=A0A7J6MEH9_PERCH|nr:hypothetical protein FOL47_002455 [Perkinsus chesapeaki]